MQGVAQGRNNILTTTTQSPVVVLLNIFICFRNDFRL